MKMAAERHLSYAMRKQEWCFEAIGQFRGKEYMPGI